MEKELTAVSVVAPARRVGARVDAGVVADHERNKDSVECLTQIPHKMNSMR